MNLPSPKAIDQVPIHDYSLADAIAQTPVNGVIKLANGLYPIRCDGTVIIKEGVTIRGESKTGVVIQRDPRFPINNQPVLKGCGDGISVENLTIDANAPDAMISDYAYSCLHIFGKAPRVVNVRGIRPSGNWSRQTECWAFWMVTGESIPSGIVSDCTVSDVRGNYVEGFSASGACTFHNCRVDFPVLASQDHPPFLNGYQGAGRSMFLNCVQVGGTGFFSTDTESVSAIFRGCLGLQLTQGIIVTVKPGQVSDGLTVDGCEFQLTPNLAGSRWGVAVSGEGQIRNVRVVNSIIRYAPSHELIAETDTQKCAVAVTGGSGTIIQNNVVDSDFTFAHEEEATINGNTTIARAPISPEP